MRFVMAGDFSKGVLAKMIERLNRRLAAHPAGERLEYRPLTPGDYKQQVFAFPSHIPTQHHFYLTFGNLGRDEDALAALMLLNCVYCGGLASRMHMKSRERGLTYTFNSGWQSDIDSTEFYMADQTSPEKLFELVQLGLTELRGIVTGEITDAEMERAHGAIIGTLQRSFQVPAALASWYDTRFMYDFPQISPNDWIQQARAIDKAAIKAVGRKYIDPKNWTLTLIGQGLDQEVDRYRKLLAEVFA